MIMDQLFNASMKPIANKISQSGTVKKLAMSVLCFNWVLLDTSCWPEQLINAKSSLGTVITKILACKSDLHRIVEFTCGYRFKEEMVRVVRCVIRDADIFITYFVNWNKIKFTEIIKLLMRYLSLKPNDLPYQYSLASCDCLDSNYLSIPIGRISARLYALSDLIFLPHLKKHGHHHSI